MLDGFEESLNAPTTATPLGEGATFELPARLDTALLPAIVVFEVDPGNRHRQIQTFQSHPLLFFLPNYTPADPRQLAIAADTDNYRTASLAHDFEKFHLAKNGVCQNDEATRTSERSGQPTQPANCQLQRSPLRLDRAEQALHALSSVMARAPQSCPSLFVALDWYRHHTLVQTAGDRLPALIRQLSPTAVYTVTADLPEGAIGLVCQGLSCQEPARSEAQLHEQLQQSQVR